MFNSLFKKKREEKSLPQFFLSFSLCSFVQANYATFGFSFLLQFSVAVPGFLLPFGAGILQDNRHG